MKFLIPFLLFSLSVSAQTNEDGRTVTIPFRVAKQIQKDLISKDSCTDMLSVANEEIYLLGKNIAFKETMIDTLTSQALSLKNQLDNERNLKLTYKGVAEDCKIQYDVLKAKSDGYRKFTKVVAFIGTAVVTALTVVILIVK